MIDNRGSEVERGGKSAQIDIYTACGCRSGGECMVVSVCVLASQEAGLSSSLRGRVTGKGKGVG